MKIEKLNYYWHPGIVDLTYKINEIIDIVNNTLIKEGYWEYNSIDGNYRCSLCGGYSMLKRNYCPDCGCKMGLEEVEK